MIDVEAAYAELRELVSEALSEDGDPDVRERLAEAVKAIDAHLAAGGALPLAWQRKPTPAEGLNTPCNFSRRNRG